VYSFLVTVWWVRRTLFVLAGLTATWWAAGADSWFEDPVPDRLGVFLILVGLVVALAICTVVLSLGLPRLPDDQRVHLLEEESFWKKVLGLED
jgi:hypothetical protein